MAKKGKSQEQKTLEQFLELLLNYRNKNDMVLIVRMMNALKLDYGVFIKDCVKAMTEDVKAKIKELKDAAL